MKGQDSALDILDVLLDQPDGMGPRCIAAEAEVTARTVRRVMARLQARDMAYRLPDGRWALNIRWRPVVPKAAK